MEHAMGISLCGGWCGRSRSWCRGGTGSTESPTSASDMCVNAMSCHVYCIIRSPTSPIHIKERRDREREKETRRKSRIVICCSELLLICACNCIRNIMLVTLHWSMINIPGNMRIQSGEGWCCMRVLQLVPTTTRVMEVGRTVRASMISIIVLLIALHTHCYYPYVYWFTLPAPYKQSHAWQ